MKYDGIKGSDAQVAVIVSTIVGSLGRLRRDEYVLIRIEVAIFAAESTSNSPLHVLIGR